MELEELAGGARALLQLPNLGAGLAALALLAAGAVAGLVWARLRAVRRIRSSRVLGRRGERRARRLLRRAGYRVVATQATATVDALVDGHAERYRVRADLLVARRRKRYVVEVKAGPASATIANRFTRRQLLEYARAFRDVDGILLVDAVRHSIVRVEFP